MPIFLLVLVLSIALVGNASAEPPTDQSISSSGTLTFFLENDLFIGRDDEYTSGVGLSWTSEDSASYRETSFIPKVLRAASILPKIGDPGFRSFASFTLGQEIYTPQDIHAPIPPLDEQPYAGVLFLDSSVFSHGASSMHEFTLRLGCVGPCSGAEQTQKIIHDWIGAPVPQGWDYQLHNEPLLNVSYQYRQRLIRHVAPKGVDYDLSYDAGASLGNYFTGANVGLIGRIGFGLPDTYGNASLRTGGASRFVGIGNPPPRGWQLWAYVGAQVFGIARFLPTDGNTFRDSPSGPRENFSGYLSAGLVAGYRRFVISWSLNSLAGLNEIPRSNATDFGTLTLSYTFGRKSN